MANWQSYSPNRLPYHTTVKNQEELKAMMFISSNTISATWRKCLPNQGGGLTHVMKLLSLPCKYYSGVLERRVLEKAFDRVPKGVLWGVQEYRVPCMLFTDDVFLFVSSGFDLQLSLELFETRWEALNLRKWPSVGKGWSALSGLGINSFPRGGVQVSRSLVHDCVKNGVGDRPADLCGIHSDAGSAIGT